MRIIFLSTAIFQSKLQLFYASTTHLKNRIHVALLQICSSTYRYSLHSCDQVIGLNQQAEKRNTTRKEIPMNKRHKTRRKTKKKKKESILRQILQGIMHHHHLPSLLHSSILQTLVRFCFFNTAFGREIQYMSTLHSFHWAQDNLFCQKQETEHTAGSWACNAASKLRFFAEKLWVKSWKCSWPNFTKLLCFSRPWHALKPPLMYFPVWRRTPELHLLTTKVEFPKTVFIIIFYLWHALKYVS